jgi:alkane 1-monooxygenase
VCYPHFTIEHVRGHHANVATHHDPASAQRGESFYRFWIRSVIGQLRSAWHLETQRLAKKNGSVWRHDNLMLRYAIIQLLWLGTVTWVFGLSFLGPYVLMSIGAFSLLEAVNYVEHYGLARRQKANGKFERVDEHHSWNSDHLVSRALLFELTRHSDHHMEARRPYQTLRSHSTAPNLPTGYPGMILLALVPPIWYKTMDPILVKMDENFHLKHE